MKRKHLLWITATLLALAIPAALVAFSRLHSASADEESASADYDSALYGPVAYDPAVPREVAYIADKFDYAPIHANRLDDETFGRSGGFDLGLAEILRSDAWCGYVVDCAMRYLRNKATPVRGAAVWKYSPRGGGIGHTMIEVKVKGRWILYDVSHGVYLELDGKPLSLVEAVDAITANKLFLIRRIVKDDDEYSVDVDSRTYYKSVTAIGLIRDGSTWYFGDAKHREAAERYARETLKLPGFYRFREDFMTSFYPLAEENAGALEQ